MVCVSCGLWKKWCYLLECTFQDTLSRGHVLTPNFNKVVPGYNDEENVYPRCRACSGTFVFSAPHPVILFLTSCVHTTCVSVPNDSMYRMHMLPKTTVLINIIPSPSLIVFLCNQPSAVHGGGPQSSHQCVPGYLQPKRLGTRTSDVSPCLLTRTLKLSKSFLSPFTLNLSQSHFFFLLFCSIVYQC